MTKKESIFILFSITLCWSSTYIFIKDIPQEFSVYAYLALTSGVAGILLTLVMRKKLALLNRVSLRQGLILGALITASNMFEKLGLDQIPASSASVYASMGIIMVPLIMILKKEYPSRNNMVGILIILIGILTSNWGNTDGAGLLGGLYILGSAASMSVYTVLATEYTKETDPSLLTVLQMLVTALFGFVLWMATDAGSLFTIEWSKMTLSYIFLIAFFSKCYAYLMLMHADKYADPVSVTIVASTEPVVTLLAAVLLPEALGFGLETVFGKYYPELISVTFFNNLVFTITFGLPVLIVLTSTDFGLDIWVTRMLRMPGNFRMPGLIPNRFAAAVCFIDTVVLGAAFVLTRQGMSLGSNPLMKVLAVLTVACAVATCLIGGKEVRG